MSGPEPAVFDVRGPLPQGTTVLEASAGTGKTFTIAALATRYVAEGHARLGELMLVTFGRAATSELRDRVRERLVGTERALRDPAAASSSDPLVAHLAADGDAEREARRRRLTRALAEVDAATITTTHGFCQQMLTALGTAGDVDRDAVLVPDVADLVDEVTTDVYLRLYAGAPERPLTPADARKVAREAISVHDARLAPDDADPGTPAWHRWRFAREARAELVRRKRGRRLLDYDDLLVLLRDALADPATGPHAVDRVRSRYAVVMVDEFQDTDPVQWEILRTAFGGHRTLVLIGDPKQAIYAFRGADVVTYLTARREADATATLGTNWRSDSAVLDGLAAVLGEAALGDPEIAVRPVAASHTARRLRPRHAASASASAPVRLRQVTRAALGHTGTKPPRVPAVRELIYADVAAEVVRSLEETEVLDAGTWRPLRPGDVAVLTRRNADASAVRAALAAAGVPAVESGVSSVFTAPAARHWLTLLSALSQPGNSGRVAAAALTPFLGWDARRLAEAAETERDALADTVRTWAHVLDTRGVAALVEAVGAPGPANGEGLVARLMRGEDGERVLTDVRHIGQSLHAVQVAERLGTGALTEWLRRRIADAEDDYAEERSRRLETDAAAVQVVTVHASKGLEFPVVHVPFAWDRFSERSPAILRHHADDGARVLHVGGPGSPGYDEGLVQHRAEDFGEDLRLAYVALTRAAAQVVLWWAPSTNTSAGALTRLLLGGAGPGEVPPDTVRVPSDDDVVAERLGVVVARGGGAVAHEVVTQRPEAVRWTPPAVEQVPLTVATFARALDRTWRRTSYSGLTAAVHEATIEHAPSVASEPETTGLTDEPDSPATGRVLAGIGRDPRRIPAETGVEGSADELDAATPLSPFPGGAAFGTLVHEVLEYVDTDVPDLPAELHRHCAETPLARGLGVDPLALADALGPVMTTPLGPLADGVTLGGIRTADRLAELTFELPLAGGDRPAASSATLRAVGDLLRRHLPDGDPLAPYADRLDHPLLGTERLRGYLTGSIDAVLRVRGADGEPRYLVADYKTNRLAPAGEDVTPWHYRPAAMADEMLHAHYPLQLLLYTVALHRFLRWRQPGYDPERHLGGGLYLFVRGMVGPATPVVDAMPCGVFAWRPPTGLVTDLSALLDGRDVAAVGATGAAEPVEPGSAPDPVQGTLWDGGAP